MADQNLKDLSYGHAGIVAYDPEGGRWHFSSSYDRVLSVDQVQPSKECVPSCIRDILIDSDRRSTFSQSQLRFLLKAHPEIYPAKKILTKFLATEPVEVLSSNEHGEIFAMGHAIDVSRISGIRRPIIFAMPCGAAGHILRLVRPRQEIRKWGKESSAKLRLLGDSFSERGYWKNLGGTIHQIISSNADSQSNTWLAVRQSTSITIFRPIYGHFSTYDSVSNDPETIEHSLLHANPVATISSENNSISSHSDVSFNPWYPRQLAVVDTLGLWFIYNLERSGQKNKTENPICVKAGALQDNLSPGTFSQQDDLGHADGWHRILWVCKFSIIVVCNRYHLAIFDVESDTKKLQSPPIIPIGSADWIIDIKRCLSKNTHLFVLTSSQLFWIQVIPITLQNKNEPVFTGGKILLSCRHFRGPGDESLRLVPVQGSNISVLVVSAKHPLISVYSFMDGPNSQIPHCTRTSITIPSITRGSGSIRAACLTTCKLILNTGKDMARPEAQYLKHGVQFHQLWALTPSLQLVSTLFSSRIFEGPENKYLPLSIQPPEYSCKRSYRTINRIPEEPFIIPDVVDHRYFPDNERSSPEVRFLKNSASSTYDLCQRLDWSKVFEHIFPADNIVQANPPCNNEDDVGRDINKFLASAFQRIREGLHGNHFASSLVYEMCELGETPEDLTDVTKALKTFLDHISENSQHSDNHTLALNVDYISDFSNSSPSLEPRNTLDVTDIFDHLLEQWISTLPSQVPNRFRGARFRIIRELALDLTLSSLRVCVQKTRADSEGIQCREAPNPTVSESINWSESPTVEVQEESAETRLRSYAVSIKINPKSSVPNILADWPAIPGLNPALYSYDANSKSLEKTLCDDSVEIKDHRYLSGQTQRSHAPKKHLSRQSINDTNIEYSVHQSLGKGKEISPALLSSQVEDVPMTQPDRGTFGSRAIYNQKKIKKQRVAGF